MSAKKNLLDKAAAMCVPPNASALAARLGVSRQQVSRWKNGHDPMPQEHAVAAAKIAHLDPGEWWLLIELEQSTGEVRRSIGAIARRLGLTATVALCAIALPYLIDSSEQITAGMYLMFTVATLAAAAGTILVRHRPSPTGTSNA